MVSGGAVRWDSSLVCGSELSWSCCYPRYSGMTVVLQSESSELSRGWTPNPSVLSALEGSGLSGGGEFVCGHGFHESCAVVCAPRCWRCGNLSRWAQRRSGTRRKRRSLGRKRYDLAGMTWRLSLPRNRAPGGGGCQDHILARCRVHWGGGIQDNDQTAKEDDSWTKEKERNEFIIYIFSSPLLDKGCTKSAYMRKLPG